MTGVGLLFYLPLGCWLYVVCEEDSSEQPAEAQLLNLAAQSKPCKTE
jgi:hypothetical protein